MKRREVLSLLLIPLVLIGGITGCLENKKGSSITIPHRMQWWLEDIGWDEDRNGLTGKGITVAIIDSGIDTSHPDLANVSIEEYVVSSLKKTGGGLLSHGTAVAGIIAAYPHDENGALGVAPEVDLVSIDVSDNDRIREEDLIEGINIAMDNDVDIINISLGVAIGSESLHRVIKQASNQGIIIVAAAGNNMKNGLLFPAGYDEVIAVGAKDKEGAKVSPTGLVDKAVFYLPGKNISTICSDGSTYAGVSGTSFSCAIMSGIISLALQKNSSITQTEIVEHWEKSTLKVKK